MAKLTCAPTEEDVATKIKYDRGEIKSRPFLKVYPQMVTFGFNINTMIVYSIIRNSVAMFNPMFKNNLVGSTAPIKNDTFSRYSGIQSHNTISRCIEELKQTGFINYKRNNSSRIFTLLRDVEQYQPEEIKAINSLGIKLGLIDSGKKKSKPLTEEKTKTKNKSPPEKSKREKIVTKKFKNTKPQEQQESKIQNQDDDFDW